MRTYWLFVAAFLLLPAAGCFKEVPKQKSTAADASQSETEDDWGRGPTHPYYGWATIDEPFGDESSLMYKLTPSEVVIGKPVEIEVHCGSAYGPMTDTQVMVRTVASSNLAQYGYLANPAEGKEWTQVEPEGIYVQVYDETSDSDKEIRYEPDDPAHRNHSLDTSGHTRFVTSVTTSDEEPVIQLRWYTPSLKNSKYLKEMADVAMQIHPEIQ